MLVCYKKGDRLITFIFRIILIQKESLSNVNVIGCHTIKKFMEVLIMCGVNNDGIVTELAVAALKNEKFFENMTTEEKIKAVCDLYKALHHVIANH